MFSIREARGRDGTIIFKYHFALATQNVNPYLISTHQKFIVFCLSPWINLASLFYFSFNDQHFFFFAFLYLGSQVPWHLESLKNPDD